MEDVFMKYGMVILGVFIITIMIVFAFKANKTSLIPLDEKQFIEGDSNAVEIRISALCDLCLGRSTARDCYIIDTVLTTNLTTERFSEPIVLAKNISMGKYMLKLRNRDSVCEVMVIE
ncbi:MAG: hypothetical protein ABIG95_01275 [Candidatus Woesearchaeota archaeon]